MLSTISTCLKFSPALLSAFILSFASVGTVSATSVTTPGLSVSSGGLTFSNFTCDFTGSGMNTGSCASINVSPLTPPPAGIEFFTTLSASNSGSADSVLTFDVAAPGGVNDVGLSFGATFLGLGVDSVTELVYSSLGGPVVGYASVICSASSGCTGTTSVNIKLSGTYTSLYITKDISVSSYGPTSGGSISTIEQTFAEVPEPKSIALVGVILMMGSLARRTRIRPAN